MSKYYVKRFCEGDILKNIERNEPRAEKEDLYPAKMTKPPYDSIDKNRLCDALERLAMLEKSSSWTIKYPLKYISFKIRGLLANIKKHSKTLLKHIVIFLLNRSKIVKNVKILLSKFPRLEKKIKVILYNTIYNDQLIETNNVNTSTTIKTLTPYALKIFNNLDVK